MPKEVKEKKKKRVAEFGYEKNTVFHNKEELVAAVNRSLYCNMLKQTIYDDNTESLTVEIHIQRK